jgi:hypothetical protein
MIHPAFLSDTNAVNFHFDIGDELAYGKAKSFPNSRRELFQLADEGIFLVGLRVFVLEPEEFEYERIFDLRLGSRG